MKLFILGAGKGTRLWPLVKDTSKLLLDLGDGSTLLDRLLRMAERSHLFNEVVLIAGYKVEKIEKRLNEYEGRLNVKIVYNPFYEIANNLISLWTAHYEMLDEDFVITNGDNVYKDGVLQDVVSSLKEKEGIALTIDNKQKYDEDDMKVTFDDLGYVKFVSKEIESSLISAESVGLCVVKGKQKRELFRDALLALVREKDCFNKFWLEVFNKLASLGEPIIPVEIESDRWKEIDFHPDIALIRKLVLDEFHVD